MRRRAHILAACILAGQLAGAASAADRATIEAGMQVYKGFSGCQTCHGWDGKGGPPNDTPGHEPGPTLIPTTLARAAMIELFSCGTPGGRMPQYLAEAWSARHKCSGKVFDDLATDERPPKPYSILTPEQIAAVAEFVAEFFQGKPMTLANCVLYNGPDSRLCELLR